MAAYVNHVADSLAGETDPRAAAHADDMARSEREARVNALMAQGLVGRALAHCLKGGTAWPAGLKQEHWAEIHGNENVIITGPVGVGKTTLAWLHLCFESRAFDRDVGEVTAAQFVRHVENFRTQHMFGRYATVPVLLFDDLRMANWAKNDRIYRLWDLLNARYVAGLRTIVTADASPGEIQTWLAGMEGAHINLHAAITERLQPLRHIALTGKSRRTNEVTDA